MFFISIFKLNIFQIFADPKRKMSVYDDLILHISPDKFYVESLTASKVVLVIDRINYNVSLETNNDQIPAIASRLVKRKEIAALTEM